MSADFAKIEREFCRDLREPDKHSPPKGVEYSRFRVYRELLYNNVERFIADHFPVIRRITPNHRWHALVGDYFARHIAHTPLFTQIAREFLEYLLHERDDPGDPTFLQELAHYECVESALFIDSHNLDLSGLDPEGDLLTGRPVISPLAWSFVYRFPVHRIRPEYQPTALPDEPSYLVVYRDRQDTVGFMEINAVTARLLRDVSDNVEKTGQQLLEAIAHELKHPKPQAVIDSGLETLRRLHAQDIVLGISR